MKSARNPSIPNTRRRKKNPLEGVTGGWPSATILRDEAEARAANPVPYIVLEGAWLRDCGFEIGRRYAVRPGNASVVIEPVG